MNLFYTVILVVLGLASVGIVVAGGIFAFISAIGIVPRMAKEQKLKNIFLFMKILITLGGIFGTTTLFVRYHLPIGNICGYIFVFAKWHIWGCLAIVL